MTNKEMISILHGIQADNLNLDDAYTKDKYEALDIAIKTLERSEEYKDIFLAMFNHIKRVKDHYMNKHLNREQLSHDEIITFGNYVTLYNACINALIDKEIKEIYLEEEQ